MAHLMSSWEAICQIFTTVGGGRPKKLLRKVKQIISFLAKYDENNHTLMKNGTYSGFTAEVQQDH